MPQLNIDGKTVRVDGDTAQRIMNISERPEIKKILDEFWTEKKLGRHTDLKSDHGSILLKTLQVDPEIFREDLMRNKLKLGNFSSSLESVITGTKLSGDLKSSYVKDCLGVTTVRPAIGKGEFLFAASFVNLGFSSRAGDLVDLDTGAKIEVKGISAVLGNSQGGKFRPMTAKTMGTVFNYLGIDDVPKQDYYLSEENAKKIKTAIGLDREKAKQIFTFLQNLRAENEAVARDAVPLYFEKKQLIRIVAAMHLYAYMKIEMDDYLLIVNDEKFSIFRAPDSLEAAYDVIEKMNLKPWREGEYGIKVTLGKDTR